MAIIKMIKNPPKTKSNLKKLMNYITPVSYTHLDVYKRQAFDFPAISNPTGQRAIGEVAEAYSKGTG